MKPVLGIIVPPHRESAIGKCCNCGQRGRGVFIRLDHLALSNADPGSARLAKNDRLSSRVELDPLQGQQATNRCIAAAEVMLFCGHLGTNPLSTIACRPGP